MAAAVMNPLRLVYLGAGARIFVLLAAGAPVLWTRDFTSLASLVAIAVFWGLAFANDFFPRFDGVMGRIFEALLTGAACAAALPDSLALLAVLIVPPFVAGLDDGAGGTLRSLAAQLIGLVAVTLIFFGGFSAEASLGIFTWTITGLGVGFIASFLRSTLPAEDSELQPYVFAQSLIRQLIGLSDGLSSGLDPLSLSGSVLSAVHDELPTRGAAVYVPQGETLKALASHAPDGDAQLERCESTVIEAWARSEAVVEDQCFAFPLGESAVVGGVLSGSVAADTEAILTTLREVAIKLRAPGVHLDTALLFADFKDSASADERKRLAREIHDGVAQDIASLGYLVDAIAAKPTDEAQAKQFAMLRERITAVVGEVRKSVLTLRTSVGEAPSLGAAIGTLARHLSEVSGVPIEVRLDEHSARLRPEVESELFRIAQEAMNNALKHARASVIDVHCIVHAPDAMITVSDDGRGMQQGRSDSHGLKIMKERARLIKGDLKIGEAETGGLAVSVCVPGSARNRLTKQPVGSVAQ